MVPRDKWYCKLLAAKQFKIEISGEGCLMTGSWYDALWEEVGSVLHVCLEAMGVWLLAGWLAGKWDCSFKLRCCRL